MIKFNMNINYPLSLCVALVVVCAVCCLWELCILSCCKIPKRQQTPSRNLATTDSPSLRGNDEVIHIEGEREMLIQEILNSSNQPNQSTK